MTFGELFKRMLNEPVMIAGAVRAVILAGMALGLIHISMEQLAVVMIAVEAVLAPITRALVTPNQLALDRVAEGGSPTVPRGDNKPLQGGGQ